MTDPEKYNRITYADDRKVIGIYYVKRSNMNNKAVIAMSGGVDSSVAAYLMKQRGFDCIGATMKLFANEDIGISREHS